MAAVNIPRVGLLDTFNIWRTRFNQSLDVIQSLTDIVDTTSPESGLNVTGNSVLGNALTDNTRVNGTLSVSSNATVEGDLAVNGGDITTTSLTATLFDSNATTLHIGRAATTVSIGATTGNTTIRNGLIVSGTGSLDASSTLPALRVTQRGTGHALLVEDSTNPDSTPTIIDANGDIIVGSLSPLETSNAVVSSIQTHGTDTGSSSNSLFRFSANTADGAIYFAKSRSATIGSFTAPVLGGDALGSLIFEGANGSQLSRGIVIRGKAVSAFSTTNAESILEINLSGPGSATPSLALSVSNADTKISGNISTLSTSIDVFNTVATSIGFAGAATTLSIGATTGTTTVNNNLTVSGNLVVNGTTTTVNSNTITTDDPILTLGGDTPPTMDDNKDRGIEFRYHNGTSAKVGFFGFDDSTGFLTFIPDATNASEIFSGATGVIDVSRITGSAATLTTARTISLSGDVTGSVSFNGGSDVSISTTIAPNSVALGTDTTGNYAASVGVSGNGLTITGVAGEGTAFTVNSNATDVNTASTIVFRNASGNFSAGAINGVTLTSNATGFSVAGGITSKTLTVNNSLTLSGTDGTSMTFPTTSATIARTDAAQTFTGTQTFGSITSSGVVTFNTTTNSQSFTTTGGGVITITSGTAGNINNMNIGATTRGTGAFTSLAANGAVTITGSTSFSTSATITAGTNAQGQGPLTSDYNVITTAANAPSGVTLPIATVGRRVIIVNRGANTVNVFPETGATIDALAVNTAISLPVGAVLQFNASSTTQWYSSINQLGATIIQDDTTTNATRYLTFTSATSGIVSTENVSSTKLTYNPSTGSVTAVHFNSTSDQKLKTNVSTVSGLDVVQKLRGVEFDFIDSGNHSSGVIAQEIEIVLPHLVSEVETTKVVSYQQIIPYLIEAIKEQQKQIDELKIQLFKNN